jgi:type IV pilus assembly protein PilF
MKHLLPVLVAVLLGACARPTPAPEVSVPYEQREVRSEKGPRERAQIHTQLAASYYVGRNFAVALEEATLALRDEPNYVPALNILGLTYMELGQDAAAEQAFEKAISVNPNDSDTRNNYGWFLCRSKRQVDEAIKQFMLALRNPLYQTPEKAYVNAGECSRNKGDLAAAEDYYQKALQQRPGLGRALLGLADIDYRRGQYKNARALLDQYRQSSSATAESLWLLVRLERKLGDKKAEAEFARELRRGFPDSPETGLLQAGKYD